MDNRKEKKKKKLLEGHKRVGKRFIPPMKQLSLMNSISYVDNLLPELIWIGLVNEKVGYIKGARILETIFKNVENIKDPELHNSFALMSSFNLLNAAQKAELVKMLEEEGTLDVIINSIAPLTILYDNCPLLFFGLPTIRYEHEELVNLIKICVGGTIDKYDTPGIVLNGAVVLARLVTGKLKFTSNVEIPDFNAVIDSPDSDEAKRAAAFMRSNALMEFGMHKVDTTWAEHFWNRGIELSPCEF